MTNWVTLNTASRKPAEDLNIAANDKHIAIVRLNKTSIPSNLPENRDGYFSLFLLFKGEIHIMVNASELHLSVPGVLDIFEFDQINIIQASNNIKAFRIYFTPDFLNEVMKGIPLVPLSTFMQRNNRLFVPISKERASRLRQILNYLEDSLQLKQHLFQKELMKVELRKLNLEVLDAVLQARTSERSVDDGRTENLIYHFVCLVHENSKEHHDVQWYAEQIGIDVRSLARLVKRYMKVNPRDWIYGRMVAEAKRSLCHQDTSIQEVANQFHFSDQSAFGKFFKRKTGLSPQAFREQYASLT